MDEEIVGPSSWNWIFVPISVLSVFVTSRSDQQLTYVEGLVRIGVDILDRQPIEVARRENLDRVVIEQSGDSRGAGAKTGYADKRRIGAAGLRIFDHLPVSIFHQNARDVDRRGIVDARRGSKKSLLVVIVRIESGNRDVQRRVGRVRPDEAEASVFDTLVMCGVGKVVKIFPIRVGGVPACHEIKPETGILPVRAAHRSPDFRARCPAY